MSFEGKDYVFAKAIGDAEWWNLTEVCTSELRPYSLTNHLWNNWTSYFVIKK